jgi:hypothetical protein
LNVLRAVASIASAPSTTQPSPHAAVPLPGLIEAEDFDDGPAGIAYGDGSSGNYGGAYRGTDVDVEATTDSGGGYNVGWITAGEWLEYTIDVAEAGAYALEARVASDGAGGSFHIEVASADRTGRMTIPDTGGWQSWQTLTTAVALDAGLQKLRVVMDADGPIGAVGNLNWIRLTRGSPAAAAAIVIEAEDFEEGPAGTAYEDLTGGNSGGEYRSTDVDIEGTGDTGGGYNVGWMSATEWLQYSIPIPTSGTYLLEARVAAEGQGGTFHVEAGGIDRTGALTIPDTGGWQTWQTVTVPVTLDGGVQRLRIVIDSNGESGAAGNINWLRLVPPPASASSLNRF